ncbi:hypothetical protein [Bacillus mycoides]|uniref:hypothetical protein n=1 Tax=Bacillus mycoides TaxID=1405 RepID=UPI001C00BF97|nr:hypothetical protein [Bacillus mycoides]QWG61991.1 hypothetical protein EXW60_13525 [Bacillus mycoides]QWG88154.1 hypothetical protein EXW40_02825 [Bacillus mycoides]
MDLYTEKVKDSDSLDKMYVCFKSHRDYLYSGWEINQISNSLNNVYYKNELINTLKSLLLNGTNPKDIYVLSSSVKIGNEYKYIKDGHLNLRKSQGIINLYYMGSPIPLIPNGDVLKIHYLFEIFRSYYKRCNSLGLTPPKRRYTIHNLFEKRDRITQASIMKDYLKKKIYESNPLLDTKELDEKVPKVFKTLESSLKSFDNLFKDLELLNDFNIKYSESIEEGLKLEKYIVLNKYFNFFKKTFNNLDRPIICVHNRQEDRLEVLCTDLISLKNFTEGNYRFFETKNISQNSPLFIATCIGIGLAPSILKVGESLLATRKTVINGKKEILESKEEEYGLDRELKEQDEELNSLIEEIKCLDAEITKIENSTTENEAVNKANELISNYTSLHGIEGNYAINTVSSLDEKNNETFKQTLQEKDFTIDNVTMRENEAS